MSSESSPPATTEFELNEILKKIGFGQTQIIVLLICGLINMYMLVEIMGISILASAALCDLKLTPFRRALLRSSVLTGLVFSSYFMGYFSDKWGRLKILKYSIATSLLLSISSMFMNFWQAFGVLRLLLGISLGGISSTNVVYLGEFSASQRFLTAIVNGMSMFSGLGMIFYPGLASFLLIFTWRFPLGDISFRPWRLLGLSYTLPGWIAFMCLFWLPESPKYLYVNEKYDETMRVLNWLCLKNRGVTLDEIGVTKLTYTTSRKSSSNHFRVFKDALPLLKKPLVDKILLCCFIHFFILCITRGLGLWFGEMRSRRVIFEKEHSVCAQIVPFLQHEKEAFGPEHCNDYFTNYIDGVILGVVFLYGYFQLAFLLRYVRPKVLFLTNLTISSAFGFLLTWVSTALSIQICFILFMAFSNIALSLLGSTIIGFAPTHLRAKAIGLCDAFGRVGVILSSNILGIFLKQYCMAIFCFFAACPLVAVCFAIGLPFKSDDDAFL